MPATDPADPVVRVPIASNTSGDITLVAAVAGKKIRVLGIFLVCGAAANLYFSSGAGGSVIFGGSTHKITIAAAGDGFALQPTNRDIGWMETVAGEALVLNTSSTGPFSGGVIYTLI
jgi:hypothetical protein